MGPPYQEIHVIQMLNILENYDLKEIGHIPYKPINRSEIHMLMIKAFGDPDFDVPVSEIIDKQYAATINSKIKLGESILHQIFYLVRLMIMKVLKQLIFQWLIKMEMWYLQPIH